MIVIYLEFLNFFIKDMHSIDEYILVVITNKKILKLFLLQPSGNFFLKYSNIQGKL